MVGEGLLQLIKNQENERLAGILASGFVGRTLGIPLPVRTPAELFSTRTRAFSKNRSKPLLQGCVDTYAMREKVAESRMREFIQSFPLTYLLFSSLDPHSPPTGAKLTLLGADSMRITD